MSEIEIGEVTHYYNHLHVGTVQIVGDELHVGDMIHVKGHTSDFMQRVESMEFDHEAVDVAKPGDNVGILLEHKVREHDKVYIVH